MTEFLCPVCKAAEVSIADTPICPNCRSEWTREGDGFVLTKAVSDAFRAQHRTLRNAYYDDALTAERWDRLAGGRRTESAEEKETREQQEKLSKLPVVTTESIPGAEIVAQLGMVSGYHTAGMGLLKDFSAGISDIFGGQSRMLQDRMKELETSALTKMRQEAFRMGADGVVGVSVLISEFREGMLIASARGTAVKIST